MFGVQNNKLPAIPEFFKDKSVFITGGSGFLGKLLVEKLLRSCPEIKNIYFLLRQKRGQSLEDRLKKIYKSPMFDLLREQNEDTFKKIIPINGDSSKLGLGISEEDRKLLKKEVNIIYHVAASVKFTEPLKYAIDVNLRSTVEVISLAKELENLVVFAHTSTAFSNLTHPDLIEEKVYLNNLNWRDALNIANEMDEQTLEIFAQKYIGPYVNSYIFTKQLAERAVYDLCKGILPTIILRPSIVYQCQKEPLLGWTDSFNGLVGVSLMALTSLCNIYFGDGETINDLVFADNATKASIIAVWEMGTIRKSNSEIPVYNCCSDTRFTFHFATKLGSEEEIKCPLEKKMWIKTVGDFTKCEYYYNIRLILQLLPYLLLDGILCLVKKKPMISSLLRKTYMANMTLVFFMMTNVTFKTGNYQELQIKLLDEDKPGFSYHKAKAADTFLPCIMGAKKYLMRENLDNIEKIMKRDYWWRILDKFLKVVFAVVVLYILFWKYDLVTVIIRKLQVILYPEYLFNKQ